MVTEADLRVRAQRLKLVLSDCDGVLTNACVYYSDQGEAMKRFSLRDGMGVELLRNAGILTAIITRENSGPVARRAEKLKLPYHFDGIHDKRAKLSEIIEQTGVHPSQMGYIGDDVNDLGIIKVIREEGLTATPADGIDQVKALVHHVTPNPGGHGAFRAFADWILALRSAEEEQS